MANHEFSDGEDTTDMFRYASREDKNSIPLDPKAKYDFWDSDEWYDFISGSEDEPTPQKLQGEPVSEKYRK